MDEKGDWQRRRRLAERWRLTGRLCGASWGQQGGLPIPKQAEILMTLAGVYQERHGGREGLLVTVRIVLVSAGGDLSSGLCICDLVVGPHSVWFLKSILLGVGCLREEK